MERVGTILLFSVKPQTDKTTEAAWRTHLIWDHNHCLFLHASIPFCSGRRLSQLDSTPRDSEVSKPRPKTPHPGGILVQMSKLSPLAPFYVERSSFNLIPSWMTELLSLPLRAQPPFRGAHFCCRHVQSQCFNHCPEPVATGEGTYKHWPVNQELLFHTQLSLHHRSLVQHPHHHTTRSRSPAPPSPHSTKPCDTWIPSLGAETCSWPNVSTPLFTCWGPWSQPDICPDLPDETLRLSVSNSVSFYPAGLWQCWRGLKSNEIQHLMPCL